MKYEIRAGDCVEVMCGMDEASVDAIVTDPPYGLEFMGKEWDGSKGFASSLATAGMSKPGIGERTTEWPSYYGGLNPRCRSCGHSQRGGSPCTCVAPDFPNERGNRSVLFQAWCETWAVEALRVLKPGGHLLAFGGTRTSHRLTCALEDAGFEIRDCLMWLYGSGFPKSKNISDGRGTALKPAWEPIILARKPLIGTVADNVLKHGTGALNIDASRIGTGDGGLREGEVSADSRYHESGGTDFAMKPGPRGGDAKGRWPANLVLDEDAAALLDEQTGTLTSGKADVLQRNSDKFRNTYAQFEGQRVEGVLYGDSGGASRFFYTSKASTQERTAGGKVENKHPTVKPVDLMQYLCRLVTPPGGLILDPFCGSGSTLVAALPEGFRVIGIERDEVSVRTALARIREQGDPMSRWE